MLGINAQRVIAQTNIVDSATSDGNHNYAIDGNGGTFYSNDYSNAKKVDLTIYLSKTVQAAKVSIVCNLAGIILEDYYTTNQSEEDVYYINPNNGDGFSSIHLSSLTTTLYMIKEIEVYEISLDEVSLSYNYDAAGNTTDRSIVLSVSKNALASYDGSTGEELTDTLETKQEYYEDVFATHTVHIYPNPTQGQLKVEIPDLEPSQRTSIKVYTAQGNIVYSSQQTGESIDLINQANGLYLLEIDLNGEKRTWRIIKE